MSTRNHWQGNIRFTVLSGNQDNSAKMERIMPPQKSFQYQLPGFVAGHEHSPEEIALAHLDCIYLEEFDPMLSEANPTHTKQSLLAMLLSTSVSSQS